VNAIAQGALEGLQWSSRPDFVRALHIAALDTCVVNIGWWWHGDRQRDRANHQNATERRRAMRWALVFAQFARRCCPRSRQLEVGLDRQLAAPGATAVHAS
jgi:hypothetical protein